MKAQWITLAIVVGSSLTSNSAHATDSCKPIFGLWSSEPRADCTSPVGICTIGQLRGFLRADYEFTMATLVPTGDATIPSVRFYTGLSELSTRNGELVGTDAGSIDLDPFGDGKFSALITITDGTKAYEEASGFIQIRGTLDFETNRARGEYLGKICAPRLR